MNVDINILERVIVRLRQWGNREIITYDFVNLLIRSYSLKQIIHHTVDPNSEEATK